MINRIRYTITRYSMLIPRDRVLIALSGGADSTALLLSLKELSGEYELTLLALYIDHCLRPKETPYEINHCRRLCSQLGVDFHVEAIDVEGYCVKERLSTQEGARELRYKGLHDKAREFECTKIALGHTADDQIETVLMRLIRGTGVSGLSGIPPVRGMIIRPLIEIERLDIEDYVISRARKLGLNLTEPFIMESSNLKRDYLRNRMRLVLMPELKRINPSLALSVLRLTEIVMDEERYFELLVTKTLMRLISRKGEGFIELFCQPMESIDRALLRRLLRRAVDETTGLRAISFSNIEDIAELVKHGGSGSRIYIGRGIRVIKGYSTLLITSLEPPVLQEQTIDKPGDVIVREAGLVITASEHELTANTDLGDGKSIATIDAAKTSFPLVLRSRRKGDVFYPLGLAKRKKLQDFFVDEKVPRDERNAVPLITWGDSIVWVVGYRIDERFKVDKDTQRVIKFQVRPLKK